RQLAHMHLPLAQLAAGHALHKLETDTDEASELNQIERLLLQAEIRQLSGQHEEATPLLQSAWNAAQRIQTELAGKLAENAAVNSDAHLAGFEPAAAKSGGSRHPGALIAAARVSLKNGDNDEAQRMSAAALGAAQDSPIGENAALMRQLGEIFVELKLI